MRNFKCALVGIVASVVVAVGFGAAAPLSAHASNTNSTDCTGLGNYLAGSLVTFGEWDNGGYLAQFDAGVAQVSYACASDGSGGYNVNEYLVLEDSASFTDWLCLQLYNTVYSWDNGTCTGSGSTYSSTPLYNGYHYYSIFEVSRDWPANWGFGAQDTAGFPLSAASKTLIQPYNANQETPGIASDWADR